MPSLQNLGHDIEGSVEGKQLKFQLKSTDNPHRFSGIVEQDKVLEGSLDYRGFAGPWSATKHGCGLLDTKRVIEVPG